MNGKVAILTVSDLRNCTMIKLYTEYFKSHNIEYDIICSKRYNSDINYDGAKVYAHRIVNIQSSKVKKLVSFIEFRQYAIKVLKKNKYDFVVLWNENTAVLFYDYIVKYAPFCVNIRDIDFSRRFIYFSRLSKSVRDSSFSTWCAQGGLEYLPKGKYTIVLNQNKDLVDGARKESKLVDKNKPIHIGVVGNIRHIEPSKELMRAVKNDARYIIQFFGMGSEILKEYAKEIDMHNVEISGSFNPSDTSKYLDRIDVLNVYTGDGRVNYTMAPGAPIRYGYSTLLYKPAIVSPNTYLAEKSKELNISYIFCGEKDFANDFYDWYYKLDFDSFVKNCDNFTMEYDKSIKDFYDVCYEKIIKLIQEKC